MSEMETRGPYEARVCKDISADCCDYGVVSLSEGREVCRVWREQDARAIASALAARPAPEAGSVGLIAELRHAAYTEPEPTRSSLHLKAAAAIAERDERLSTARMIAEAAEDQRDAAKARASELQRDVERLREVLNRIASASEWSIGVPVDTEAANEHARIHSEMSSTARAALLQEGK